MTSLADGTIQYATIKIQVTYWTINGEKYKYGLTRALVCGGSTWTVETRPDKL